MISRRLLLGLGVAAVVGGATIVYAQVYQTYDGREIDAAQAQQLAEAGQITLVDIRRPDEWADTGTGAGALPIDMRDTDFVAQLTVAVDGNRDAPIALICARGVRSARLANELSAAGFTQIINVPEGMTGWVARGLPVTQP